MDLPLVMIPSSFGVSWTEGVARQILIEEPVGVWGLLGVEDSGVVAGRKVAAMERAIQLARPQKEQVVPDSKACSH